MSASAEFSRNYKLHLQHLGLKGLQPKTIDAYARAVRRVGERFGHDIGDLTEQQLTDYFTELLASHSWSAVKLDLYGLKFYYEHVLRKPWAAPGLVKPPKGQRLPDTVTVAEAQRLFAATRVASYRVFFFTLYSLGLRQGEGLHRLARRPHTPRFRRIAAVLRCRQERVLLRPSKLSSVAVTANTMHDRVTSWKVLETGWIR